MIQVLLFILFGTNPGCGVTHLEYNIIIIIIIMIYYYDVLMALV